MLLLPSHSVVRLVKPASGERSVMLFSLRNSVVRLVKTCKRRQVRDVAVPKAVDLSG